MENTKFEQWCIVELMGHQRMGGLVSEAVIAGKGFLRIDVYQGDANDPVLTRFVNPDSLYALNPVDEKVARAMKYHKAPISPYQLDMKQLVSPVQQDMDYADEFEGYQE